MQILFCDAAVANPPLCGSTAAKSHVFNAFYNWNLRQMECKRDNFCIIRTEDCRQKDKPKIAEIILNPFSFIRGLFCPRRFQASVFLNCLRLTIPGFLYILLNVSFGDICFFIKNINKVLGWKSGQKVHFYCL